MGTTTTGHHPGGHCVPSASRWGDSSRRLAESGTTLLVSSHVMEEAGRCDHLLLMREGRLLARESPAELRARTGEQDLEAAFLALIRAEEAKA